MKKWIIYILGLGLAIYGLGHTPIWFQGIFALIAGMLMMFSSYED